MLELGFSQVNLHSKREPSRALFAHGLNGIMRVRDYARSEDEFETRVPNNFLENRDGITHDRRRDFQVT
jgi:hypothetical protein